MPQILRWAALALCLGACGEKAPEPVASPEAQHGRLFTVPTEFIGSWKMTGQECEADSGERPTRKLPDVIIRFDATFRYEMFVEGWRSVGKFRVDRMRDSLPVARLEDVMYEFEIVDGRLENWSEGEAVYQCGNIFRRNA